LMVKMLHWAQKSSKLPILVWVSLYHLTSELLQWHVLCIMEGYFCHVEDFYTILCLQCNVSPFYHFSNPPFSLMAIKFYTQNSQNSCNLYGNYSLNMSITQNLTKFKRRWCKQVVLYLATTLILWRWEWREISLMNFKLETFYSYVCLMKIQNWYIYTYKNVFIKHMNKET
jgi:hypothetical protein